MQLCKRRYLNDDGLKGVKAYKYSGRDDSLLYNHVLSPMAGWLVDKFMPSWVAPNVITVCGMTFILMSHLQYWYYSKGEEVGSYAPSWVHYLAAFNIVLYSTFDNMDGKQARKTGSSSTYGMLVDHGVDCIMAMLLGLNVVAAVRMDQTEAFYTMIFVTIIPAYAAVWETYQLKGMFLPIINGPNEGLLSVCLTFIWTGFVGSDWWQVEQLWGYTRAQLLVRYCFFFGVFAALSNTYKVLTHKSDEGIWPRIQRIIPELIIIGCLIVVERVSPSGIAKTHFRSLFYFFLFFHAKLDILLQTYMAASQKARIFRLSVIIPAVLFAANSVVGHYLGKCPVDEVVLLKGGLVYSLLMFVHFVLNLTDEMTTYLGIRVFSISKVKAT